MELAFRSQYVTLEATADNQPKGWLSGEEGSPALAPSGQAGKTKTLTNQPVIAIDHDQGGGQPKFLEPNKSAGACIKSMVMRTAHWLPNVNDPK